MLVYLALSSHGFGHAARQAAVLAALHALHPQWRLVVSCALNPAVLTVMFHGLPLEWRTVRWDVGMVQKDALSCDPAATLAALEQLDRDLPEPIDQELAWIQAQGMPVVVLADIPPSAARLAHRLGAPLVWMGNFGWDDIYATQGEAFARWVREAHGAYSTGDLVLRMPFHLAMHWGIPERRVGLIASRPRALPLPLLEHLNQMEQELVLVGFGGLGMTMAADCFAQWPHHHFVMSPPTDPSQSQAFDAVDNLTLLPQGLRPLDVMPHCQRLIGKPGFSTFAEALTIGIGLHVVERDGFAEAAALIAGVRSHGAHRILSRSQFDQGAWELDRPLLPPREAPLPLDGAHAAATVISQLVGSRLGPGVLMNQQV
ncbi:MAG: hypothetical protein ACON4T_08720 [Synechococcus sp.]